MPGTFPTAPSEPRLTAFCMTQLSSNLIREFRFIVTTVLDNMTAWLTNNQGLATARRHLLDPLWPVSLSITFEVGKFTNVMSSMLSVAPHNSHFCATERCTTSLRLLQIGFVETHLSVMSWWNAAKTSHQWFLSRFSFYHHCQHFVCAVFILMVSLESFAHLRLANLRFNYHLISSLSKSHIFITHKI